jgi:hypothetical protein
MTIDKVRQILNTNDGSLPDINFDFDNKSVVGDAYALIQGRATCLMSKFAYYWSKGKSKQVPICFGENPALDFLSGDAEAFHVVFGGLQSSTKAPIPDLGIFVLGADFIALDYRMGPEWNEPAILGLFEIMKDLKALSDVVRISHSDNINDSGENILLTEFERWLNAHDRGENSG